MTDLDWTANVVRRKLPNGLTVLVERNTTAPVVAAVTHVRAGYFDEPDEWVGIAHVLEHMFFKGTARRGSGELAQETQRLGGYLNAGTIYDKTIYYTVLPSMPGALAKAVDLQADALMHCALDPGDLQTELEVIIQEAMRKLDNPSAVAGETLYELLFAQHRIRRWRIGTEAELRRLTASDLRRYYETRYTPSRTIVALVGDLDLDEALELAEATYGSWTAQDHVIEPSPSETDTQPSSRRIITGDVQRPLAILGWRSVDVQHPDVPALDVASSVLGAGRGSWLSRAIRNPGMASGASSSHYTPTEVGVFSIRLDGDARTIDDAVSRALELTHQLAEEGPDEVDLQRVRALAGMQWFRRLETMDGRATLWTDFEALGDLKLANEFYDRTMAVGADGVRDVARRYLHPDTVASVLYLTPDMVGRYDGTAWPPSRNGYDSLTTVQVPEPAPQEIAGSNEEARHDYRGGISHFALGGADLLLRPKRGTGLVFLGMYAGGLRESETRSTAGVSSLMTRAALRGTDGMSAEQIALAAEALGGAIAPSVSLGAVGWGITVRSDALREAAELLRTVATEATFAPESVGIERSLQASDAERVRDDMFSYPVRRVLEEAFPDSAYGLPGLGDPDLVREMTVETVREWAERLRAGRISVAVVGDLEVDGMREAIAPLASWTGARTAAHVEGDVSWNVARARETRDKAQSAMAMAFPTEPYGSPDRIPLIVTGSLLSGLAGRLFHALREERSLAYTVTALPWLKRRAGAMITYIANSPEREDEAREAMLAELRQLSRDDIGEDELERARNYSAGALQLRLQSSHSVASEMLTAWVHGTLDEIYEAPDRLRRVTEEDVRRVAERAFDETTRTEFVIEGTGGER